MADNKWTTEQLKAIELKGRRLLVSAAAGSGKTAVLVERIIRRIMDAEDPVQVDRLLVMTFTKAAAAEMKERIRRRLQEALEKETVAESSLRLREQLAIIDSASIQTIDSFCMNVVRDHTDELDIDPNVRVADEAELTLLKADVMSGMLEEYYEKADDAFINFVEAYGQGTSGAGIEGEILKVYGFAQVHRDPEKWYEDQLDGKEKYAEYIYETLRPVIAAYTPMIERLVGICNSDGGPKSYEKSLIGDLEFLDNVAYSGGYEEMSKVLRSYAWPAIGRKGKNDNEVLVQKVKDARDGMKKKIKEWTDTLTREDISELEDEEKKVAPYVSVLVGLAADFDKRLAEKKREKNIIDFNDLEHMALRVLEDDEDYKERFDEIYVDEYQDTNDIQEAMINALDRGRTFMVGDVKQSIYKFRQAKPEIFMDKYERFTGVEGTGENIDTVIELNKNFRSRRTVLDSTNRLFKRLMVKALGGVEYTDEVALYPGADYPEIGELQAELTAEATEISEDPTEPAGISLREVISADAYDTEMLLVNIGDIEADDSKNAAEARMIADKIREITNPANGMKLWDRDKKALRPVKFSDIVILLRSSNVAGDVYLDTLLDAGMQAHCETNKGYFDSPEIRTMTALLTAIDNPRREIAMAAFLKSPIIGLTDDELVAYKKAPLTLSEGAAEKVTAAQKMLEKYREQSRYMSMDELITEIYDETGYYDYAAALPAGKVRKANLDKLRSMAAQYASTGYKGLFNFIRYIENLRTYDTDFGEASAISENDDAVRIMSIHKSKGLEFPIVFLANCDKKVNQMDSNEAILMDSELGIGCVYVNTAGRYKEKTVKQMALRLKLRSDTLGEELRVLYVAMTRAKEKLFITGCVRDSDKFIQEYEDALNTASDGPMELSKLRSDAGYLYWINGSGVGYKYTIADIGEEVRLKDYVDAAQLKSYLDGIDQDEESSAEYDDIFRYDYPGKNEVDLVSKISISELKRRYLEKKEREEEREKNGIKTDGKDDDRDNQDNKIEATDLYGADMRGFNNDIPDNISDDIPYDIFQEAIVKKYSDNIKNEGVTSGAERGTIYHKVMEKLDYDDPKLDELPECVDRADIEAFIDSELGQLFKKAQQEGRLYRERQFIMGLPADELGLADSKEPVLVQGIIDAYIEEDDGIILVDYKTDRVTSADELTERYSIQLHYYAMALEKMKNKPVKSRCIWSFSLKQMIALDSV